MRPSIENKDYKADIKICPLCDKEIDCAAKPKVYTTWRGKQVHFKCIDALVRKIAAEKL